MPEIENLEALAWLDRSLQRVRERGQYRTEVLLERVMAEVLFELDLPGEPARHVVDG